ncbi:MAG: hypothetical protein HUJ51_00590, partial [Eggerthellaceae bacterium]|nr:hypothetical protein [Eggerthellaceae bacterium]
KKANEKDKKANEKDKKANEKDKREIRQNINKIKTQLQSNMRQQAQPQSNIEDTQNILSNLESVAKEIERKTRNQTNKILSLLDDKDLLKQRINLALTRLTEDDVRLNLNVDQVMRDINDAIIGVHNADEGVVFALNLLSNGLPSTNELDNIGDTICDIICYLNVARSRMANVESIIKLATKMGNRRA